MQVEWAQQVIAKCGGNILILAPLGVCSQTRDEAKEKLGIDINVMRKKEDLKPGINTINYEMIDEIDAADFVGVVLDESSILKNYSGKTKTEIIDKFKSIEYKLACTATPSPNDHMEILNHAEYLGYMKANEALAIWFINDTMNMGTYKLKKHAEKDFWRWVSSWAISISKPSDLGYSDEGFELPALYTVEDVIDVDQTKGSEDGNLFRMPILSATDYHKEKRATCKEKAEHVAEIVKSNDGIYCIWVETNYEADAVKALIPEAVEVRGSDSVKKKEQISQDFAAGKIKVLISKPSIFGYGMNFQKCHKVIYCGISYSFEDFYQSLRRFYRFGQKCSVECYTVIASTEYNILKTLQAKDKKFQELKKGLNEAISEFQHLNNNKRTYKMDYKRNIAESEMFKLIQGDCCEEIKSIPDESVDFEIFSPPFSNLYIYSDSYRDMGNCKDDNEFFTHFEFLIPELHRILLSGRLCAVHCKQLVMYKGRDGAAGLRDFRGDIIRAFMKYGFVYHSEVCIWKDPVIEMQRTKSHGLLYKQLRKDSSYSRQGLPDYLVIFRKWGEDKKPISWKTEDNFELPKWQEYASPVWMSIQQTNVLNVAIARDNADEKHICPLQLDVIERAVEMWSNPGDTVFSPFAGIGSEGYQAILQGRKFLGIELKDSYFNIAAENLKSAEMRQNQGNLFSEVKK